MSPPCKVELRPHDPRWAGKADDERQALDERRPQIAVPGYEWRGKLDLPGRRYGPKPDRDTGRRLLRLHCYADGSPDITRHLAFRDYPRRFPETARGYAREKLRCHALHPDDSHACGDCKARWIERVEAEALAWQPGPAVGRSPSP